MRLVKRILFVLGVIGISLGALILRFLEAVQPTVVDAGETLYVNAGRDNGLIAHWRFDEVGQSHTVP